MTDSAIQLYGFQKRWLLDDARFKVANICRQSGKSFMVALDAVMDSAATGNNWVMLSAGERQSKELMEKAKMHCEAMSLAASNLEERFFEDTHTRQLTIELPNRARIIGLPANPDTARGFSANVVLDEFAFHKDSAKIWQALFPTVSRGYKLRVVSTPQGKSNKFYSIFTGDNNFSKHFVDIYKAVEDGVPHNIAELKAGIDDEDAWQQEYLCQFLDEATAFLTYEMISACESSEATESLPADFSGAREFYLGIDVGRRRDLTVVWILEKVGDVFWTRAVIVIEKTAFSMQEEIISALIRDLRVRRCCIDSTGIGMMLAERLGQSFGTSVVEPVMFTNQVKQDLAVRTRRICEDKRVRLPIANAIRSDLHSVKKTVTAAGNIRFDAEHTKDGHADRFWALALALAASDEGVVKPELIMLGDED
jgi:phage FluMu gp28-like protein